MREMLAAIENSRTAREVLDAAGPVARLLGARLEAVYAHENDASVASAVCGAAGVRLRLLIGEPAAAVVRALDDRDVVAGAIGAGRFRTERHPVGRVTRDVIARIAKPVVVVPPEPSVPTAGRPTVVVALDGAGAVGPGARAVLARLAAGADLMALRLLDPDHTPCYWDHYHHDFPAWYDELVTTCPLPVSRIEPACGSVADAVRRVAEREHAALVAVPWSQDTSSRPGQALTELLRTTRTPVLLVPEPADSARADAPALASSARLAG